LSDLRANTLLKAKKIDRIAKIMSSDVTAGIAIHGAASILKATKARMQAIP
jgi:hypothetical protein